MNWLKKNSKTYYLDFIKSIEGDRISNPLNPDKKQKAYFIRHDVDYDLDHALRLAMFENMHDIQSTYFLLHTAPYFDYSPGFEGIIKLLVDMGHSVGFHNDVLSLWWDNKNRVLMDLIEKPVFFLMRYAKTMGTSAHGKREHYDRRYINYQLWSQYNQEANDGFPVSWPQISLKTMNFAYEAYFLPYTHYFSDSGNNWIGYVVNGRKPFERRALESRDNIGPSVINEFNRAESGLFQLLIHPEHWGVI